MFGVFFFFLGPKLNVKSKRTNVDTQDEDASLPESKAEGEVRASVTSNTTKHPVLKQQADTQSEASCADKVRQQQHKSAANETHSNHRTSA